MNKKSCSNISISGFKIVWLKFYYPVKLQEIIYEYKEEKYLLRSVKSIKYCIPFSYYGDRAST